MARLVISVVIVAVGAGLVLGATAGLRRMTASSRMRPAEYGRGAVAVKQMSFVLLVALIFYAAIWGAG